MAERDDGYAHPKCYARSLRGCSTKISGEHVISESILHAMGGKFKVEGFPWIQPGTSRHITTSTLQANNPCKTHNSTLSPLDNEAKRLFDSLQKIDSDLVDDEHGLGAINEVFSFDGKKIERWLLKVLCGFVYSYMPKEDKHIEIRSAWLDVLFGGTPFCDGSGMYVETDTAPSCPVVDSVVVEPLSVTAHEGERTVGIRICLSGVTLVLFVEDVTPHISEGDISQLVYRPAAIIYSQHSTTKRIDFSWEGGWKGQAIFAEVTPNGMAT